MDITFRPEIERLVQEKIQRGQYASVDALVQEAVHRLVEEDEEEIQETRAAIDAALEQWRRGEGRPAEEVFEEIRAKHGIPR
jgi:Arc/MetJ-type ribon-helix-helix transcriptional regulator